MSYEKPTAFQKAHITVLSVKRSSSRIKGCSKKMKRDKDEISSIEKKYIETMIWPPRAPVTLKEV